MFWNFILDKLTYNIGIDLGTSTTLVSIENYGVITKQPSVVAINKNTNEILAVGDEAKKMVGRTPADIVAIRPLRNGVITDFEMTEAMLKYFTAIAHNYVKSKNISLWSQFILPRPRVVVGVPSGITEVERRAVIEAANRAGAREVYIIEEAMAAAIGAGLEISNPSGTMIIDIGGGTADIAIISLGEVVVDNTVKIAGDRIDQEIISYLKENYSIQVGDRTAEDVKIALGDLMITERKKEAERLLLEKKRLFEELQSVATDSDVKIEQKRIDIEAKKQREIDKINLKNKTLKDNGQTLVSSSRLQELDNELVEFVNNFSVIEKQLEDNLNLIKVFEEPHMEVRGRDTKTGLPKSITLTSTDIFEPIAKIIDEIIDAALGAIDNAPPEILGDLLKNGITLAGGGALIRNIDNYFEIRLGAPVKIAEDPVAAVVRGCTSVLSELELLRKIQKDEI